MGGAPRNVPPPRRTASADSQAAPAPDSVALASERLAGEGWRTWLVTANDYFSPDVNLAGGVSAVNFDDSIQWWQAVIRQFREQVIDPGYGETTPAAPSASK